MAYSKIFDILFPVFFMIALGYAFGRIKKINIRSVVDLVLFVTVPCLVLSSLLKNPLHLGDFVEIGTAAAFVILVSGALTYFAVSIFKVRHSPGIYAGSMFINSGILAFPIASAAFGLAGLAKAVVYDAMNSILIFSLGVFILVGRENSRQIFKLPVLYSIFAALILSAFKISFPQPIIGTLSAVGDATIPLMLLILGYQLNHLGSQILWPSLLSSMLRLAGGLSLAIIFTRVFGITGLTRDIVILSSSMPTAMNALALSEEYKVDADLVASTVAITTLLSFITIPLVMRFVI